MRTETEIMKMEMGETSMRLWMEFIRGMKVVVGLGTQLYIYNRNGMCKRFWELLPGDRFERMCIKGYSDRGEAFCKINLKIPKFTGTWTEWNDQFNEMKYKVLGVGVPRTQQIY